jgi:2-methylisocitrate lyase-like PEP mutase family enzyme
VTEQREGAARFRALHERDGVLLLPNPWDVGTARVFAWMGFEALATTSAGHAGTLGRHDGGVTLDEALAHAAAIVAATDLPVTADFENGFADDPDDVAANVRRAVATGLAGCSVEDSSGHGDAPVYEPALAAARVAAAVEAARREDAAFVVTARAQNHLHGRPDLADTIARLQSYQEAGADVLYAPGVTDLGDIRSIVASVDRPVNVLALPGAPPVEELAAAGVRRVSVGSGFYLVALGAVVEAARELRERGTYDFWRLAGAARGARAAFDA